jgi:hypothetical protein
MREGGLYRLCVDPITLVHTYEELDAPSTFEDSCGNKKRRQSMIEEYNFILQDDVWKIVP